MTGRICAKRHARAPAMHPNNNFFQKGSKMPKLKTKSAAKKRFSVTGTGKLKRNFANKRHLLFNKGTKMKRQARGTTLLNEVDVKIVKQYMPYI